jgi:hypothetical protein
MMSETRRDEGIEESYVSNLVDTIHLSQGRVEMAPITSARCPGTDVVESRVEIPEVMLPNGSPSAREATASCKVGKRICMKANGQKHACMIERKVMKYLVTVGWLPDPQLLHHFNRHFNHETQNRL